MRLRLPHLPLVLPLLFVLMAGCGRLDEVDVPLTYELKVASGLAPGGAVPGTGTSVSRSLANEGVAPGDVDSARLTSLQLVHEGPDCDGLSGCDLGFIERLEVSVEAPGQPRQVVGLIDAPRGRTAEVPLRDVELAPYVTAEAMTLSADIRGEAPVAGPVTMRLEAVLRVDVDVL